MRIFTGSIMTKRCVEDQVFRPHWPEGVQARKVYRFQCDDCCATTEKNLRGCQNNACEEALSP